MNANSTKRLTAALWTLLAISPAFLLAAMIWRFGVGVPYWDESIVATAFIKLKEGTLSWSDMFALHFDHRPFFPRVIILGLGHGRWDVRNEMFTTFALAAVVSGCLYRLQRPLLAGAKNWLGWVMFFVANVLVFGLPQHFNWLTGFQVAMLIPIACLCIGLVAIESQVPFVWQVALSALLSIIGMFSFANAVLLWVLFPIALVLRHGWNTDGRRRLLKAAAAWVPFTSVIFALYFHNFERDPGLPSPFYALRHPLEAVAYFLAWAGSPFALYSFFGSIAAGLGVLLVFGIVMAALSQTCRTPEEVRKVAPWLTLAAFSLLSGLLTTAGRLGFGLNQAMHSRYTTIAVYLLIATVYLLTYCIRRDRPARVGISELSLAAVVSAGLSICSFHAVNSMEHYYRKRLVAQAVSRFWDAVPYVPPGYLFPSILGNMTNADAKQAYSRLWLLGVFGPRNVQQPIPMQPDARATGALTSLRPTEDGALRTTGWAQLSSPAEPAHAVLLAASSDGKSFEWTAMVTNAAAAEEYAFILNRRSVNQSAWDQKIPMTAFPKDASIVRAWAYNALKNEVYPLGGEIILNNSPQPRTAQ